MSPYEGIRFHVSACLLALLVAPQALAARAAPLVVDHITPEDGLSQNTVMDVLQDGQGFLWFATENGLNRYDGYEIVSYNRDRGDSGSLSSDYIWQIAEDAAQDLWLATDGGGLVRWNRQTDSFTTFRHDPADPRSIASNAVRAVLVAEDGRVWAGTRGGGLNRLDPATGEFTRFLHDPADPGSLSDDSVQALLEDDLGRLWVGTENGLNRFQPATASFVRYRHDPGNDWSLSGNSVIALYEDGDGALWVGTLENGLNRHDSTTGEFERFAHDPDDPASLSNDHVRTVLEDEKGRLWVGTADGLNLFRRRTGEFMRYYGDPKDRFSLNDSYVMAIYQDRSGVMWLGTRGSGVARWNPRSWSLGHYRDDWLDGAYVMAFADAPDGTVWVGTMGAGLVNVHLGTGAVKRLDERLGLADDRVMSLLRTRDEALWIGTLAGGLYRLDLESEALTAYRSDPADPGGLSADGIMSLHEDGQGNVWIGTFGGGLGIYERDTQRVRHYADEGSVPPELRDARVTALVTDPAGAVWVGTDGRGLIRLDVAAGTYERLVHDPADPASLSANTVYSLHVGQDGVVWAGTAGGGLDRLVADLSAPGAFAIENYSRNSGLTSDVVYGIQPDSRGHLWLSGNAGLNRLNPANGRVKAYHRSHGLQGEEFNFGAHHRGRDGRIYFGGNNGFNAFYPAGIEGARNVPSVVLTGLSVLNAPAQTSEPYPLLERVDLGYAEDVVTFEFAALDFVSPERNRYKYMLEGFDPDWNHVGSQRSVTYTNLDAGTYLFRVKAANSDGLWNDEGLSITLRVGPPPWGTVWAYCVYAALLALAAWLAFRWHLVRVRREEENSRRLEAMVHERTAELEVKNDELIEASAAKSEFLAKMSHEIRTPMNGVLGMTELLLNTSLTAKQDRFAGTIRQSAESLLQIINDILDFSKIEAGKLELGRQEFDVVELIDETVDLLATQAGKKGLTLLASPPPELQTNVVGDPLRLRQILVNLVGNAIKFTDEGDVVVRGTLLEETGEVASVKFEVRDTGVGIPASQKQNVFEAFAQADGSAVRAASGTGLGLSICKQLVELMGGRIGVESEPGAGSNFWFTIPLGRGSGNTSKSAATKSISGLRILARVSHRASREALERTFAFWGTDATFAQRAGDFERMLQEDIDGGGHLDAVVLDGDDDDARAILDVLARQRQWKANGVPYSIVLGPSRQDGPDAAALDSAADTKLAKPLRHPALRDALVAVAAGGRRAVLAAERAGAARAPLPSLVGRVLVVDDNAVNQMVAEGMLTSLGCEVEIASDGAAGVARMNAGRFDLILMDCLMPVMDGFQATAAIRACEPPSTRIPIVALTANATEDDRRRCLEAGMDDYLSKPLTMEALQAALERWLPAAADASAAEGASPA